MIMFTQEGEQSTDMWRRLIKLESGFAPLLFDHTDLRLEIAYPLFIFACLPYIHGQWLFGHHAASNENMENEYALLLCQLAIQRLSCYIWLPAIYHIWMLIAHMHGHVHFRLAGNTCSYGCSLMSCGEQLTCGKSGRLLSALSLHTVHILISS